MFDLELTARQRSWLVPADALADGLRTLAAAAERDRKPSIELLDMIAAGRFPVPTTDAGRVDPLAVVLAASWYAQADPGAALAIVGSWHVPILLDGAGHLGADPGRLDSSALIYEGFGRQPSECTTTAAWSADGWIIDGRKESVLQPGAAGRYVVLARDTATHRVEAFLLDGDAPGLSVERDDATDGKLGLRAAHTGSVRLAGVTVPDAARLVNPADELAVHRAVALCRSTLAGVALGCARASLAYAMGWAQTRHAFGKLIAGYQGVSFVLADLETAIASAELLLWDTVTRLADTDGAAELERRVARAVARATAAATEAGRQGVNVLGVHGIVTEHPVERWYRASASLAAIDFDPLAHALDVA